MGKGFFRSSVLEEKIPCNPPSLITGGKDKEGFLQGTFAVLLLIHVLEDHGEMKPIILLKGGSLDGLLEIVVGLPKVHMTKIPSVQDTESIEGVWVVQIDLSGQKELVLIESLLGMGDATP
jgi:hypothetical protein